MTISDYKEAFEILNEHAPDAGPEPVYPSHEKLEVFVDPGDIPETDVKRLEDLGFHSAPDGMPEPHFYTFV